METVGFVDDPREPIRLRGFVVPRGSACLGKLREVNKTLVDDGLAGPNLCVRFQMPVDSALARALVGASTKIASKTGGMMSIRGKALVILVEERL
jgi:hypothetical protein